MMTQLRFPSTTEIPKEYRIDSMLDEKRYLVDGVLQTWEGDQVDVFSPICTPNGEQIRLGSYPKLSAKVATHALNSAKKAYDQGKGNWATMTVKERIGFVEKFIYKMKEKRENVVKYLMWGIAKNRKASEKEFDRTIDYINDTIDELKNLDRVSSRFTIEKGVIAQIRRAPLGVVLVMGPFNYPINETFTLLLPALIMGNTVIFRPPTLGALMISPLLEAFKESFPPGVINIIFGPGSEVIPPLMTSGDINVLTFIGSSKVAKKLKQDHPQPQRLRSVLGMDANNVGIVLPDADLELAAREALLGSLSFNGQRCTALKVLYVHRNVVEKFKSLYLDGLSKLKVGMPWDNADITPMPDMKTIAYLEGLVSDALKKGAKIINPEGGKRNKTLMNPVVLYPANQEMLVMNEEQFGPVVPIAVFDDIDEPIDFIVHSNFGQQVSLFGTDSDKMAKLIDPLVNQVCRVNINSQSQRGPDNFPFTGRKNSAEQTLSVHDALRAFSIRTLVAAKKSEVNEKLITEILRERKSKFLSTDFVL